MKKLFTLILAVAAFAMGAEKAYAEPTETLEITMKSGTFLRAQPKAAFALEFLEMVNQIKFTQEGDITYVYSMSDKHLMTINTDNSYITLAPNVTDADDISYTITDADREMLRETDMDIYDVLKDYKAIKLHFDATELKDLEVTLKTGKNIYPDSEDFNAIYSLVIFGQIVMDFDSFSFLTLDNKLLFTFTQVGMGESRHYVVNLAQSVSSADDIVYTITDQDRKTLEELDDPTYKLLLADRETIQLHFDTSTGEDVEADWEVNIETGASITEQSTELAVYFMCNFFHQMNLGYDESAGLIIISSLNDKVLFYYNENDRIITVAPGVGPADDIFYTITDEDRMQLLHNQELYPYIEGVKTIQLHFIANDQQQEEDWVAWLKTGDKLEEGTKAWDAALCLMLLEKIKYVEEGDNNVFYSLADKKLFTIESSTNIVTLAPGVSSADDIIHNLTPDDLMVLNRANKGTYIKMVKCKTVQLHFDTSGGTSKVLSTSISLDKLKLAFDEAGQTYQLKANILPENATSKKVTWSSDNPEIATVDDKGLVTATGNGITFIHASTTNGLTAFCRVSVGELKEGTLGTQGEWYFANGVLTVDYCGQMPQNCTSKTTDPEIAYRLKWIDFLADIKEIVITGVNVEIQPYFLYYEGDGPSGSHPDDHVKKLTLGSGVKKVGKQALTLYDLKDVYCYGIEPPVLASDLGESNCFWKSRIQANHAFLHLVPGASTGYARTDREWMFFNRDANYLDPEDNPVDIKEIDNGKLKIENEVYDLSGRKIVNRKLHGVYIKDGKKFVVK